MRFLLVSKGRGFSCQVVSVKHVFPLWAVC